MAKPNYAFAKRQRDLAKKQKKEEKRLKKMGSTETPPQETPPQTTGEEKPAS
jgi:translation elongation factor EF-4